MGSNNYNNFFKNRLVLVTGGAGFIGSHIAHHLARNGAHVRVLDDFSTGHRSNLSGMDVSITDGSILEASALNEAIRGCSLVFHEAAFVSVPDSFDNESECFKINVEGTKAVLEAAKNESCDRVMFASSAACYGSNPNLPSCEDDKISAESPYAQSKVDGEELMRYAGLDTVSFRYFNVFGERQDPCSQYAAVVSAFVDAINNNRIPTVFGDGKQSRDFTHVDNIVHANLLAASHPKPLAGEIFNVGTGSMLSLLELLQALTSLDDVRVDFQPVRTGDITYSCANINKITELLGYSPVSVTEDSLHRLLNYSAC